MSPLPHAPEGRRNQCTSETNARYLVQAGVNVVLVQLLHARVAPTHADCLQELEPLTSMAELAARNGSALAGASVPGARLHLELQDLVGYAKVVAYISMLPVLTYSPWLSPQPPGHEMLDWARRNSGNQ